MKDYLASEIRNVCLLGHSGSGKTSFLEAILYHTKAIERLGSISEGNTTLDYDGEEVKRGLSIYSALAPVEWKNCKINFIDTPGYLDYEGEVIQSLAVADNVLIVVNGKEGVEHSVEKAFKKVSKEKIPTIFFINKMDEENASFFKTYEELREKFGKSIIPFEVPIIESGKLVGSVNILRKKAWYYLNNKIAHEVPENLKEVVDSLYNQISESIAMGDDELMEKFFNGETFSEEDVIKGLKIGVRNGEIRPVYCGSAVEVKGIERILDLISEYFPAYEEKGSVKLFDENDNLITLKTNEEEELSAFIFKTIIDPFVGRMSFIKVTSGVLKTDSLVYNLKKDQNEKINQIFIAKGKNQVAVGKLFTGDIGVINKLQFSETNDTLSTKKKPLKAKEISFPKAMLGFAIEPKTKNDEDRLSSAISKILEEDKTISFENNTETHQQLIYTLGEQASDVFVSKLKNKYKVEINLLEPKVQYRETIRGNSDVEGKHKKQSGGAGQYGHVKIRFEPTDSLEMIFEEEVFGGSVPKQYFPAVEQGLRECMNEGVLAGYKVVGVKATLYDGSYHEVDSKEIAFKAAARIAYKEGISKAKPALLEPIGKAVITVPEEYTGTIIGDINKRRGVVIDVGVNDEGDSKIEAEIPLSEVLKYPTELRSLTQGRGSYTIEFDRYEFAPMNIAEKVIKEANKSE